MQIKRMALWLERLGFIILIWLIGVTIGVSQVPTNVIGQNPNGLKWKQINTDKVQVVFPVGQENDAKRVADIASFLYDKEEKDIGQLKTKISIFLHGHRVSSNGLVTVGPFRSEFYQTSPQMANTTDYLDLLTIHEYRHVQQFANASQGITKLAKNIFGSWAWGGMLATALPRWYFEGDAVIAETDHSDSGRGRLPSFLMQYNALFDADKNYNYEKAGAGSLKDFVPSWYPLGYSMLRYGREHYGEDLWAQVASDAVRYKGIFTPFSRSLKKRTGLNTTGLYNATMAEMRREWNQKDKRFDRYDSLVSEAKKVVTNNSTPIPVGDGIVYTSGSYNSLPAYYQIDKAGTKTKLVEHGILTDSPYGTLSSDGQRIYWAELAFNNRWRNRQWSVIYSYDILTKRKKQITHKSRYYSPDISQNGKQLIAVEITESQEVRLVILDSATGQEIAIIPNPKEYMISQPRWLDGKYAIAVFSKDEYSFLGKVDITAGATEQLTPATNSQLSHPFVHKDKIYFAGAYSEVNNIYSYDQKTGTIKQLTHSAIGAFQPSVSQDGDQLFFSEFAADGLDIKSLRLEKGAGIPLEIYGSKIEKSTSTAASEGSILSQLPQGDYTISKYSKLNGLINPHSLLANIDDRSAELILRSDNKLSTMSMQASARYDFNEDRWGYRIGMNYAEFYPIINASVSRVYRSAEFLNFQPLSDTSLVFTDYIGEWAETNLSGGVTIPYNFSKGNMSNALSLRANYIRTRVDIQEGIDGTRVARDTLVGSASGVSQFTPLIDNALEDGSFSTVDVSFGVQMLKRQAPQHLEPRLGGVLFGRFRNNLNDADYGGDVLSLGGNLFLPGIGKNHSLNFEMFFQQEDVLSPYRYGDAFAYPRGYNSSFRRDEFGKVAVNYAFPIAYPDMALGGLAFIKRLKGNVFYDHGWLKNTSFPGDAITNTMRSVGFELGVDFRALRLVEVDLGLRYSYILDQDLIRGNRHQFDFFVISISE